jgi:16S rRNA (adenine1518-N6/adenine1519-N6)-dimethyltransferase
VKLGLLAVCSGRFNVAPGSFLPPPRVHSSVVRLDRREWPGHTVEDLRRAAKAADAAFSQRRKTLRNSVAAPLGAPPAEIEAVLCEAGIDPGARAESLNVVAYLALGAALTAHGYL